MAIDGLQRSYYCGELGRDNIGDEVTLFGWVQNWRDHGGVVFIDLKDRSGIVQVVFDPQIDEKLHARSHKLRSQYCIGVKGKVRSRPEGTVNPNIKTGEIEVVVNYLKVFSECAQTPFPVDEYIEIGEETRLKYRYLDLRKPKMQHNIMMRSKANYAARTFLHSHGFIDIETPMLTKSTPEGARDFLVPSRLLKGKFYALPQSPQLFKQLFMVSGFDRYYQIVKCFRDEDLRADRQPEFTQIDIEMSFVSEEDVMEITEGVLSAIFKETLSMDIHPPFKRITYDEAMKRFGSDKPDMRFGLELTELTGIISGSGFKVFDEVISKKGIVFGLNCKKCGELSRKDIDDLTELAGIYGAKGLAWIRIRENELQSPIVKFFKKDKLKALLKAMEAEPGDILFFVADKPQVVFDSLGALRLELGRRLNLINKEEFNFVWVTNFPLFEWNEEEKRYEAMHHPFTSPVEEHIPLLEKAPDRVKARAYDITLNGVEIGGGSIRIHRSDVQELMFKALNIDDETAQRKFGFLIEALKYGAPPHGGIALGFDRIMALILKENSIREVIPFPKTQKGICLMTDAPNEVDEKQLNELSIRVIKKK